MMSLMLAASIYWETVGPSPARGIFVRYLEAGCKLIALLEVCIGHYGTPSQDEIPAEAGRVSPPVGRLCCRRDSR